jgi:hypothetical protein
MVKKSNACRFLVEKKLGRKRPLEDLGVDGRDERYLPSDRHNIGHGEVIKF